MKSIPLRELPGFKTIDIIRAVIERPNQYGVGVAELRARIRVLDALEMAEAGSSNLMLEDADHGTIVKALNSFQFGIASKALLGIIDDILDAPAGTAIATAA